MSVKLCKLNLQQLWYKMYQGVLAIIPVPCWDLWTMRNMFNAYAAAQLAKGLPHESPTMDMPFC